MLHVKDVINKQLTPLTLTRVYDLDSDIDLWRRGPYLPLLKGASVQCGDTFLAVGGERASGSSTYSDEIWEFSTDPANEMWIRRDERLK